MKILHIIPSYKPAYVYGGPIESVARLCETLVNEKNEVDVYTTTANGKTELNVPLNQSLTVDGVSVTYFRRITKDPTHISPALWLRLYQKCKGYDIVHIHSWWNILVIVAAVICHLRGTKVIVSPRGMLSDYIISNSHVRVKRLIHSVFGRWALKNSVFHATAEAEYRECQRIIPHWNGFVLPNILELPAQTLPRKHNDVFTLLYLSRIHPKKGLEILFDTISQLNIPVLLKVAGTGDEDYIQSLKNRAVSLNIESTIEWIGWQDRESKFREFLQADLFVLPSYNENFANTVVEALSVGTPVLITPHVGLANYIQKCKLGWVCKLNSSDMAITIKGIIADDDSRIKINLNARKEILSTFSVETLVSNYIKCYQQVYKSQIISSGGGDEV